MSRIYVFTVGNPTLKAHVDDSFLSGLASTLLMDHFHFTQLEEIRRLAGGLYAWGSVEGKRNVANWEALQFGDFLICGMDNRYHYVARVVHKVHSPSAAEAIWTKDEKGRVAEYMYFLTRPFPLKPPKSYSQVADYLNAHYVGLTAIGAERLDRIRSDFSRPENFFAQRLGYDAHR